MGFFCSHRLVVLSYSISVFLPPDFKRFMPYPDLGFFCILSQLQLKLTLRRMHQEHTIIIMINKSLWHSFWYYQRKNLPLASITMYRQWVWTTLNTDNFLATQSKQATKLTKIWHYYLMFCVCPRPLWFFIGRPIMYIAQLSLSTISTLSRHIFRGSSSLVYLLSIRLSKDSPSK